MHQRRNRKRSRSLGPSDRRQVIRGCRGSRSRDGLTLLEVLLALAILGGAMAAIGELMRIGTRSAEVARGQTTSQIICETKMSEIGAGLALPQAVARTPVEDVQYQADWFYTIAVEQVDQDGLISVMVTVQQSSELYARPVTFSLVRWMIDPMTEEMEEI